MNASERMRAAEYASLQPPDTSAADRIADRAADRIHLMQPDEANRYMIRFCDLSTGLSVRTTTGGWAEIDPSEVFWRWLEDVIEREERKKEESGDV